MSIDQQRVVRQRLTVPTPPERTFELFTERMDTWWPRTHSIGTASRADVVVEPRPGGRWFERGEDGSECPWGRVAVWEPPGRLVLVWQISAEWRHDPDLETEVEVTFTGEDGGTVVELEHRGLERFGERADAMREIFASRGGWPGILAGLAAAAG